MKRFLLIKRVLVLTMFIGLLFSPGFAQSDEDQVKEVLKKYHDAIEVLDATNTVELFAENSSVG